MNSAKLRVSRAAADSGGSDAPGRLYTSRQAMHDANTSAEYI